ncbi:class I SAM-dependent methyltransferase [Geomonas sp. Red32]|uniref:class I SAM-dependent methyltransferase n=1 Tax=Geomonas sp. Red32 TaxID=2912856 RepID=UPI00202CC433|nr:class I SAM-dependent methyltransferase [Geomonas sp. Red32]MCM0083483.1 class I SAM-dependent methyltransferase [Geomonas sp. Red32]
MNKNYISSIDGEIYLRERRYDHPKEIFKQAAEILALASPAACQPSLSLVDLGSATGEFAYYIRGLNPEIKLQCIEHNPELVEDCRALLAQRGIDICCGDINDLQGVADSTFDFATSFGVTQIFEDFKPSLGEMIRVTRDGGRCVNLMMLNEFPIDVLIRYRVPGTGVVQANWNKFAMSSVAEFLEQHPEVASYRFLKHEMPFDLPPREDDPMRSWTVMTPEGKRILWNGLNMEISLYHVIIEVSKGKNS